MDTPKDDETIVTDQQPAADTPKAEDAAMAHAITQGLTTDPATKQQALEALHAPNS